MNPYKETFDKLFRKESKPSMPDMTDTQRTAGTMSASDAEINDPLIPLDNDPTDDNLGDVYSEDVAGVHRSFAEQGRDTDTDTDSPDSEVNDLRAQLSSANRRADEERDANLRSRADFANFKRRTEEERESLRLFLISDLLTRFLPLVDNFDRAMTAAEQTKDYDKLIGGVSATHRQMLELLAREGVTPIEATGQPFDPTYHNAILSEETDEQEEGTVLAELQKGYLLGNRVLRPTMVKVAAKSGNSVKTYTGNPIE